MLGRVSLKWESPEMNFFFLRSEGKHDNAIGGYVCEINTRRSFGRKLFYYWNQVSGRVHCNDGGFVEQPANGHAREVVHGFGPPREVHFWQNW